MIGLSPKWISELAPQPETGMGYQVISIILKDGTRIDQAVVVEGRITEIRGCRDIPFTEDQIAQIIDWRGGTVCFGFVRATIALTASP